IPACSPQQMLETVGRRISIDFRQLPAVFALHRTEQATDIGPCVAPGFAPRKVRPEPSFHLGQPEGPFTYHLQRQITWRWALLLPRLHGSMPPQGVWNHDNIRSATVVLIVIHMLELGVATGQLADQGRQVRDLHVQSEPPPARPRLDRDREQLTD